MGASIHNSKIHLPKPFFYFNEITFSLVFHTIFLLGFLEMYFQKLLKVFEANKKFSKYIFKKKEQEIF